MLSQSSIEIIPYTINIFRINCIFIFSHQLSVTLYSCLAKTFVLVKSSWPLHCLPSLLKPRAQFQSSPPEECDTLPSTTCHVYCEG